MDTSRQDGFLTLEQLSELLCVPVSTLYKWRARGRLPRTKRLPNGRLVVRTSWLEQWLDELPSA